MPELDLDIIAEKLVSGEIECDCPHLKELVGQVRRNEIPIEDMKIAMRKSLNSTI